MPGHLCLVCKGEGIIDGEFCTPCLGTGSRISVGLNIFLKDMADTLNDVLDKVNDIKQKVDDLE